MAKTRTRASRYKNSSFARNWGYFLRWLIKNNIGGKAEVTLAMLAIVSGVATYFAMSQKSTPIDLDSGTLQFLMLGNVVFLLALAGLIGRRLARLWAARRQGIAGSKLHSRIVGFFSLIAVGPPILMAISSSMFFEFGLQSWFSERVQSTLNNSLQVAEGYILEHRNVIQLDLQAMASDMNRQAPLIQSNNSLLKLMIDDQVAKRALSEAIIFDSNGVLMAQAALSFSLSPERIPNSVMQQVRAGELAVIANTDDDRVRAIIKLENFFDAYLYVSRRVDPDVLSHVAATRQSIAEYQNLEGERSNIKLQFNMIFIVVTLLILMAAIWVGLWFANYLVAPISQLVNASGKISDGDLNVRVPMLSSNDEIGILSRAFNRMTQQLGQQQTQLLNANAELDERSRFMEAVLSGVSAGVIGLNYKGVITLPNRSACELLSHTDEELTGKKMATIVPEIQPLIDEVTKHKQQSATGQINFVRDGVIRNFLVRISVEYEDQKKSDMVVTFDDVTEQLSDQRTAAWADVARRIAHEIKNPLTPIQLSAERLQRKYKKEIITDPDVFDQCTNTIIRQVGDLKHMVDEFSSFARMPEPVFRVEDIVDVTRKAMFLQEVANPDVGFMLHTATPSLDLICDGRLIAQAITNVMKNASEAISSELAENKDSDFMGRIDVFIRPKDGVLEVCVEDNGLGLPQELDRNIMDPYVTTRKKGTGLGLAIVRKIMEDHGGTLNLENKEDAQGARAVLRFSLAALNKLSEKK
ncbi:MAG: PAS domain-containing sensor histidine kinase [Sphingomonadales bacterium]|nr:PAS domain-containing sensor histidine kinase [Sphingomonadales bacterium]